MTVLTVQSDTAAAEATPVGPEGLVRGSLEAYFGDLGMDFASHVASDVAGAVPQPGADGRWSAALDSFLASHDQANAQSLDDGDGDSRFDLSAQVLGPTGAGWYDSRSEGSSEIGDIPRASNHDTETLIDLIHTRFVADDRGFLVPGGTSGSGMAPTAAKGADSTLSSNNLSRGSSDGNLQSRDHRGWAVLGLLAAVAVRRSGRREDDGPADHSRRNVSVRYKHC